MKLQFGNWVRFAAILLFVGVKGASALEVIKYLSPHDRERALRKSTEYIILHTTEGSEKGGLAKLRKNGEAHFCIGLDGKIYRIIDIRKIAYHAGVSMWNGSTELDRRSIGIEVVGTYKADIRPAQYKALKELLEYIQAVYRVPDERVLTHSMVAYGKPNEWHKKSHRGRKRCGVQFARSSVRLKLGLTKKPALDPDVKAGRLVIGDPWLPLQLYGTTQQATVPVAPPPDADGPITGVISKGKTPWDIAGDEYADASTLYMFPDGTKKRGNQIKDWKRIPIGTRVVVM